jgi:YfiH family protein
MPEVALPDAFEWVRYPWGPAIRCRALAEHADHFFTTREPVLSAGPLTPGDGWHRVALAMGVPARAIVRLRQVHGTQAIALGRDDAFPPSEPDWNVGDIAVTDNPGIALSVRVADCVPILLADARTGAVAAVHAGWRGTAAGAALRAVEKAAEVFGVAPRDLVAAIGPSIGPCCYRVGADVRSAFEAERRWGGLVDAWFASAPVAAARHGVPGSDPSASGNGPASFLDTWRANADQLVRAGVPADRVHVAGLCTSCHRDLFHSYRVDGDRAGRMLGVIRHRRAGLQARRDALSPP